MNEPLDLSPELSHKERLEQLEMMRLKTDKSKFFPVSRYEMKDIITELNLRMLQYKSYAYSEDFRILQTVQDFQNIVIPMQMFKAKQTMADRLNKAKVDLGKPIAATRDKSSKMIYIGQDGFTFDK